MRRPAPEATSRARPAPEATSRARPAPEATSRALAASLFLVAILCAGLVVWPELTADERASVAPPVTPVLSLRRVPAFLSQLAAGRRLGDELDRAFADAGLAGGGGSACLVVHDADGRPLYSRQPDVSLAPASTVKLLTAAAVLDRIGPDARLTTEARAARSPVDGVIDGDLWLVGGGDPLLATADFAARAGPQGVPRAASRLEDLADRIASGGVRRVLGRVLGDETRYDTVRYVPTWKPAYVEEGQSGPLSALALNGGFARLRPTPVPAVAPATEAAANLVVLLEQRGVHVESAGEGKAPASAVVVAALESLPMRGVVEEMLQQSDNTTAELLTKELGFRFGAGGTTESGLRVIRTATLDALGPAARGLSLADGSGLDRSNRATCDALTGLLDAVATERAVRPLLPVAARSGTLAGRFVGTPAAGRLTAKTGSLDDVTALSGYALDARNDRLAFTILVNGQPNHVARLLIDRVCVLLVGYPQGPGPDALRPL